MSVEHVIVDYRDRPEGSVSKLNTISDGIKVIGTIINLFRTYKPLSFFGIVSLILFIAGVGFSIPVIIDFFKTGFVNRFPTLFVCCFIILTSIISFFSGLILQTITWKNKQDFEMQLHNVKRDYDKLKE